MTFHFRTKNGSSLKYQEQRSFQHALIIIIKIKKTQLSHC